MRVYEERVIAAAKAWADWRLSQCDADELNPAEQELIRAVERLEVEETEVASGPG